MTLLMQAIVGYGDGEYYKHPFVIATADTRSVYRRFYTNELEFDETIIEKRNDSYDKVFRVSENAILIVGGTYEVTQLFRKHILTRANKNHFLEDFEQILHESYQYVRENGDRVIKHFLDAPRPEFAVRFIGFLKNGEPGSLVLQPGGGISKKEIGKGDIYSMMFAPTDDIYTHQEELLDYANSPILDQAENYLQVFFNHLVYIHSIIASQEVDTVSEVCLVYLLQNVNGKMHFEQHEIDLTEEITKIQSMA